MSNNDCATIVAVVIASTKVDKNCLGLHGAKARHFQRPALTAACNVMQMYFDDLEKSWVGSIEHLLSTLLSFGAIFPVLKALVAEMERKVHTVTDTKAREEQKTS